MMRLVILATLLQQVVTGDVPRSAFAATSLGKCTALPRFWPRGQFAHEPGVAAGSRRPAPPPLVLLQTKWEGSRRFTAVALADTAADRVHTVPRGRFRDMLLAAESTRCRDLGAHCPIWASMGFCDEATYTVRMKSVCPVTCGVC
mmetsp:Transcript_56859/g.165083  ORF Transcript_56859/g.165083 Transcript_56859/m.165083 type:complete len:145 (-) Transcript_56859:74-508(-)